IMFEHSVFAVVSEVQPHRTSVPGPVEWSRNLIIADHWRAVIYRAPERPRERVVRSPTPTPRPIRVRNRYWRGWQHHLCEAMRTDHPGAQRMAFALWVNRVAAVAQKRDSIVRRIFNVHVESIVAANQLILEWRIFDDYRLSSNHLWDAGRLHHSVHISTTARE